MITIQKLTESYLTCAVCSEEFKDPGTLDCNHTFCRQCILGYAKDQPEVKESLLCPECQEPTRVTSPDLQEWVNQVAITESITDLLNTLGPAIGACCVCLAPRETTPTTIWCSVCSSLFCDSCGAYHNKMPQSRNHKVCTYDSVTPDKTKTIKCPTHDGENIYQFCKDCIAAICLKCKNLHHRYCKDVYIIEDTVPEYTSLYQRLTEGTEEERDVGYVTRNQAPSDVLELGARIQVTCRDSVSAVREKELSLLRNVMDTRGGLSKLLDSKIDSDESTLRDLEEKVKGIDDALTSGSMKTVLDIYESSSGEQSPGSEDDSLDGSENEKLQVPRFLPAGNDFGRAISEVELRESLPIQGNLSNRSAVLHDYYDVRHGQDRLPPGLVDLVVIETNNSKRVVVTDERNKNVKLVYKEGSRQFLTTVSVDEPPFGVTKCGVHHILVTIPSLRKIHEFALHPTLSKTPKEIRTKHKYRGISHLREGHLAVTHNHTSFFNHSSVDIINTKGDILLTFRSRSIPSPYFLCSLSTDSFLVSNAKPGSVSLISERKRECIFTYKPKRPKGSKLSGREVLSPRGLAANLTGDYFVVDSETNRVVQLARSGEFKRQLLTSTDGLDKPSGICAIETDDVEEFLYVTTQQYVKVFKLK